jgi:hypothetical protein
MNVPPAMSHSASLFLTLSVSGRVTGESRAPRRDAHSPSPRTAGRINTCTRGNYIATRITPKG